MELKQAQEIAETIRAEMEPFCERVSIAGSIRRGKPEVKDVELVAVPCWEPGPTRSLFDAAGALQNRLHSWALSAEQRGAVRWIKPGTSDVIPWPPKPDGKYWRGLLGSSGLKLDLFLTTPENWGITLAIRTGSAEFSRALVTHALRIGMRAQHGALWGREGQPLPTPTEESVFEALGLEWREPSERTGPEALRKQRELLAPDLLDRAEVA
jgi:DNA polymerase/3'-5' exonuclease PolX